MSYCRRLFPATTEADHRAPCRQVFVSEDDAEDADQPFTSSAFFRVCDRHEHTISLQVIVPNTDQGEFRRAAFEHRLLVPPPGSTLVAMFVAGVLIGVLGGEIMPALLNVNV